MLDYYLVFYLGMHNVHLKRSDENSFCEIENSFWITFKCVPTKYEYVIQKVFYANATNVMKFGCINV